MGSQRICPFPKGLDRALLEPPGCRWGTWNSSLTQHTFIERLLCARLCRGGGTPGTSGPLLLDLQPEQHDPARWSAAMGGAQAHRDMATDQALLAALGQRRQDIGENERS